MRTRSLVAAFAALALVLVPIALYLRVLAGVRLVPGISADLQLFGVIVAAALFALSLGARVAALGAGTAAVGFVLAFVNIFPIELWIANAPVGLPIVLVAVGAIVFLAGSLVQLHERTRTALAG